MKLFDTINTLDNRKEEYWDNFIKKIKKHPYVYLRWISESCDEAINFFNKNKIIIKWIFELHPENYDYKYKWIDVLKQSYDNIDNQWAIVITCSYYETIKNQLKINYKDIENRLYMFDWYFLEDKKIIWKGFLSVEVAERGARKGRHPQTKEIVTFPPVKTINCKMSKSIKDAVNGK